MTATGSFNRQEMIARLQRQEVWDFVVIGGGATGLGIALDAASRGFSTLLLEQGDFSKGTSSRSTKLVHGGVRYLAQGDIRLVYEALRERGRLIKNAAHLVKPLSFVIPCYSRWELIKYTIGLKIYDLLAGSYSLGRSSMLSRRSTVRKLPGVRAERLVGGVEYFDGQFDDARLAVNLAQTAAKHSATVLNYFRVNGLLKDDAHRVTGVSATDLETGMGYAIRSAVVINATGIFVDDVLQMDQPGAPPQITVSQGTHLVFKGELLSGSVGGAAVAGRQSGSGATASAGAGSGFRAMTNSHRDIGPEAMVNPGNESGSGRDTAKQSALMIPRTPDGRVLFGVPWHGKIVAGTTDTPLNRHTLEPVALEEEIAFILQTIGRYLKSPPVRADVLSVFAGLRPLAAPSQGKKATKEISRSHRLIVGDSGLITITGGKWTTYRRMAEDAVDLAIRERGWEQRKCLTRNILIHGCAGGANTAATVYGVDQPHIDSIINNDRELASPLADNCQVLRAHVAWGARYEMARTIEDVLARRTRLLFLDARAALSVAPAVAAMLAAELNKNEEWKSGQLREFAKLAGNYILE